ncbi:putative glycerophosphodiester phosphodiesterase, protein kinase RLK-Pelle-LRK10L-2 family [Rosa chinensis]|uniref:Putative glycerophosphodiester phosphodiesterase, protein kinase RLK-Pelle-LRK10L-2 family n=1 Tax=Rosa chinensis TaxID=74649 RepID=A0A2P6SCF3_ROSCH|nr:rust resistance kinase Lr10 [Rosa chinensis]PRQ56346.1 putative glycerophosphodiester phosphodiesterase, protein kinase RLK-Pelle-LRK10L-2 family [Rosa chinensis]
MEASTSEILISFFFLSFMAFFQGIEASQNACTESMCSDNALAIHVPFRLRYHDQSTVLDEQQSVLAKFYVKHIDYINQSIEVSNECPLLKPFEMPIFPFSLYALEMYDFENITLLRCPTEFEIDTWGEVRCLGHSAAYRIQIYYSESSVVEYAPYIQSCTKMYDVLSFPSHMYLYVNWSTPNCTECEARGKRCRFNSNGTKSEIECTDLGKQSTTRTIFVATGTVVGFVILLLMPFSVFCVYGWDIKEKENQLRIERFLEDYIALKPSRYSYADIKRITNHFKHKIGEGAYGTVFKGKLSSEVFVAVKVLNNSRGDGEEFINEVGTMGRIHHVNVVRLVGFCADGFRRALVYEFSPNGALHEYISSADNKNGFLGWNKYLDISIGIAKGIEYLHQGCDQRILHFDIKPHNVLLDHNLTPKISDFGLSKLCAKDQSMVSMTTARGTIGYIAPEVFSRNFGNVSYKSDVYSFGMLLLEIVGGRNNKGADQDSGNDVYYPEWIYNLLEGGEDVRVRIEEEGDAIIAKKLAVVGLWCIQWHPVDRPSMKVVVQMLEGRENLEMPPNPFGSTDHTTTYICKPPNC